MAEKRDAQKYSDEAHKEERMTVEQEPLMGLAEFGQTAKIDSVLLAGYQRYCELTNAPKRRTRAHWQAGLAAWAAQPAG